MDAIVRCTREGRPTPADAAPLVLLLDDLSVVGGRAVFHTVLQEVCEAVAQQRSQAVQVAMLALDQDPAHYQATDALHIMDGFRDPWGWAAMAAEQCGSHQKQQLGQMLPPSPSLQQQEAPADLQLLQAMASQTRHGQVADTGTAGSTSGGQCIVIDSISTLLMRHNSMEVLATLTALVANPAVASILAVVHTDLHDEQVLSALETLSAATVCLTPPESIDVSPVTAKGAATAQPLGRLRCSLKRRTGRLRVEWCCYGLLPDADGKDKLHTYPLPPDEGKLDAQELVKRALAAGQLPAREAAPKDAAQAGPAQNGDWAGMSTEAGRSRSAVQLVGQQGQQESQEELLLRKLNSSMRLGLSEQERVAREQVVLPYEHRGEGRQYNTGDFKDYLPPAAGGHGAGSTSQSMTDGADGNGSGGRLGHILYVRDSEGEHDSDEDPDDDLDI